MTVESAVNKIIGSGNGVTTAWPFVFKIYSASHLSVSYTDLTGDEVILSPVTYTVALNADQDASPGGTVTYSPAIATGTKLTITRIVSYTQTTDIKNQSAYYPDVLEQALDLVVMQVQQLAEKVARSILLSPSQSAIGELQSTDAGRANMLVGFDSSGDIAVLSAGASAPVSAPMQAVVAAASIAAARGLLGLGALAVLNTVTSGVMGASSVLAAAIAANNVTLTKLEKATGFAVIGNLSGGPNDLVFLGAKSLTRGLVAGAGLGLKQIGGWTYARDAGDLSNDIAFAAGAGANSTGDYWIQAGALVKRLDAVWSLGAAGGMLDSGVVGNNDYWLFAIERSDTGVGDYLASLSPTSPSLPTNYDKFRLIGWLRRTGGANVDFVTYEVAGGALEFHWASAGFDVNLPATVTAAARTPVTLRVPVGISVVADVNWLAYDGTGSVYAYLSNLDTADIQPNGGTGAPVAHGRSGTTLPIAFNSKVRTNTSGQIGIRGSSDIGGGTIDTVSMSCLSFVMSRR